MQQIINTIRIPRTGPINPGAETELSDPWRAADAQVVHSEVDGELYVGPAGTEAVQNP